MIARRRALGLIACTPALAAQSSSKSEWLCPMDPGVRSAQPGVCPRCGMKLVPGIPPIVEYPLRLTIEPPNWKPGRRIRMRFEVLHPDTNTRVTKFELVHERLFHLFIVSGDCAYFAHEHPEPQSDGTFLFETTLRKPGYYRLLGDFYPAGATPQMAVKSFFSAGAAQLDFSTPRLPRDLVPKHTANLDVTLRTDPPEPVAGLKTMLFFELSPARVLEPYLGAWGHLLAASADLIDLIHTHPFLADGGPRVQFNVIFPRPGMHRLWAQFQSRGTVNTAVFTIPVKPL